MDAGETTRTTGERAGELRDSSPATYLVLARQVDLLEAEGVTREAAMDRALRAVGR